MKDESSVRGQLTFIDFLHHLAGIKINCSHFMKTLSCSGCPWLPLLGTEKSTGGPGSHQPGSHQPLHNGTRLHWDHQCHPRQCITVAGGHCIQQHMGVNPLELRPRGPLGGKTSRSISGVSLSCGRTQDLGIRQVSWPWQAESTMKT